MEQTMTTDLPALLAKAKAANKWSSAALWSLLRFAEKNSGPWDEDNSGPLDEDEGIPGCGDAEWIAGLPTTIAALVEELMWARELLELAASGLEQATRDGSKNDIESMPALEELERFLAARKEVT